MAFPHQEVTYRSKYITGAPARAYLRRAVRHMDEGSGQNGVMLVSARDTRLHG